jgi:hypothetical protein
MSGRATNALDKLMDWLSSWRDTFVRLRQSIGVPLTLALLFATFCGLVWWKWDEIAKKPGVDTVVNWAFSPLNSPNRLSGFTVEFQKFAPNEPNENTRKWIWAGHHWVEKAPNDESMFHNVARTDSLNGCKGDITKKEQDPTLEMFIPYKECANMTLYFNFKNNGWQKFGAMVDRR